MLFLPDRVTLLVGVETMEVDDPPLCCKDAAAAMEIPVAERSVKRGVRRKAEENSLKVGFLEMELKVGVR
jgi:hypothetical protein